MLFRYVCLRTTGLRRAIEKLVEEKHDPAVETQTFAPQKNPSSKPASYPAHSTKWPGSPSTPNMQGKPAPKFAVEKWFSDPLPTQNKVCVVEFWATWCGPCIRGIPHLNELAAHFGDSVSIIGVTDEPPDKVKNFMKTTSMQYGVATDTKKRMKSTIGVSAIPLSLVVGSDNTIRWQGHPTQLTKSIIQQVLSADSGEGIPEKRGRWDTSKNHG